MSTRMYRRLAVAITLAGSLALAAVAPSGAGAAAASTTATGLSAASVQHRLVALRYLPASAVTGRWDYRTRQALLAFQGWQRLERTGTAGPTTLAALRTATPPQPRHRTSGREIEVFRSLGVTLLIERGQVIRAVHSSSGKPGYVTPTGTYQVFRKALRTLSHSYHVWLPYASYFNRGIAFHEWAAVPAYPASHGCIRIPAPEAPVVYAFARMGTPVVVY